MDAPGQSMPSYDTLLEKYVAIERLASTRLKPAEFLIRVGAIIWDIDERSAARRAGISQATFYRHRPSPLSDPATEAWVTDLLHDAAEQHSSPTAETALYIYYDSNDVLLYVGITDNLPGREYVHVRRSSWMEFAARSTIERFSTREAAEVEERKRIKTLKPLFNSAHNADPDALRKLVEYLVKHGRSDLLAPAVSRG